MSPDARIAPLIRISITIALALAHAGSADSPGAATTATLVVPVADPQRLAFGAGSVWVTTPHELIRIDPISCINPKSSSMVAWLPT